MTETADHSSTKLGEIVSKTEKLAIDEKYDTNWCDMPPEIKLMCIEKMNFETRYQLRFTACAENQLVDSLRYKFDNVNLYRYFFCYYNKEPEEEYDTRTYAVDDNGDVFTYRDCDHFGGFSNMKTTKILPYVLKHCDIDELNLGHKKLLDKIDFNKLDAVLKPRSVWLKYYCDIDNRDFSSTIRMLKSCWNNIDKFSMQVPDHNVSLEELFAIPSVFHANYLYCHFPALFHDATPYTTLIKKWIEIDAKVGTKARNYFHGSHSTQRLFDTFHERSVSRKESLMRIKTDSPEKHILMISMTRNFVRFCCTVIPSDLDESQYAEVSDLR